MRLISFAVGLVVTAIMPWSMSAGDAPKRPAELQVLDYLIGDWETVVTVRGTGEKFNSLQTRRWSRDGKFVLSEELDLSTKRESHFLVTYDAKAKHYRHAKRQAEIAHGETEGPPTDSPQESEEECPEQRGAGSFMQNCEEVLREETG